MEYRLYYPGCCLKKIRITTLRIKLQPGIYPFHAARQYSLILPGFSYVRPLPVARVLNEEQRKTVCMRFHSSDERGHLHHSRLTRRVPRYSRVMQLSSHNKVMYFGIFQVASTRVTYDVISFTALRRDDQLQCSQVHCVSEHISASQRS